MKKTLYEILGVDPKASVEEIEAVYSRRLEELKVATIRDPNKLVILQQSKEILCDPAQRAAYDVSISVRDAGEPIAAEEEEPERTFIQQWGKWIAAGVILVGLFLLWPRHDSPPPQPAKPAAVLSGERMPQAAQSANTATASAVPSAPATPAASNQPPADLPANPLLGEWDCADAISGHTSKYSFKEDSVLVITSSDGQFSTLKYEVAGKVLKFTDRGQVSTLAIEELVARKMILNTGAEGRRVVCKR